MADDVSDEPEFTSVPLAIMLTASPFGDKDCSRVRLTKAVNVTQLTDELQEMAHADLQVVTLSSGNSEPSPGNPGFLFVSPPLDQDVIQLVIDRHEPDPDYGLSPESRDRATLLSKLRAGEELTPAELRQALVLALSDG